MEAMKPSKILYGLGGATLPHESTMTCYCACSRPPLKKKKNLGILYFSNREYLNSKKKKKKKKPQNIQINTQKKEILHVIASKV
jgi:hypothetical protein